MRIITGSAKGCKLQTLEGDNTRPTTERVKESLFTMIQFDIEGRTVLDLFAGSGQLGLECLSRGAAKAVFIDASREAVDVIIANAKKTRLFDKCRVSASDYTAFLRSAAGKEKFDLIFLDPPYNETNLADALLKIDKAEICSPWCLICCESEISDIYGTKTVLADKYDIIKQVRYGKTYITLLTPKKQSDKDAENELEEV